MPRDNSSLNAGAVIADASLKRRQTIRVGAAVAYGQVGIVAVLVAAGDHQQAEAQHLGETVLDALGRARIGDAGGETIGEPTAGFDLASASTPSPDDNWPPAKRAIMRPPQTGDRPGSAGVDSTLVGMASEIDRVEVSQPKPLADQGLAPRLLSLVNNPG